jgi:DNA repair photolyase
MAASALVGIAALAERAPTLQAKARVEYRDLESRSILNRCNSPRLPFQWTINPYRGCEFGCHYCYARYTHEYMEFSPAAFEEKIFSKTGAGAILHRELARGLGQGGIAIGTATDPYQPAERRFGVTREILEALREARGLKIGITTKSDLVTRDIALLKSLSERSKVSVSMTIITLHEGLARILEQRAPRPQLRLDALCRLREAGIDAGVSVAPVIPAITDSRADLDDVFAAAADCGANFIWANPLFLMPSAQQQFFPFLERHFPLLVDRYRERYESGAYLRGEYPKRLAALVERLREKHRLPRRAHDALHEVESPAQMQLSFC